ncbi:MAG TPA: type I secretion system permease/ATPase [Gammaproteobacteria bacterium]|jgi:ATP-binding cassette subfamily C protein LapB|nr:type I secretion system permease/ATPase [Gammaproteobacteria bacterium]
MHEPNQPIIRDPLLEALVAMTRLHHQPHSADSLTAALPLEDGRLTTALFIRAAASVGFNASYVQRPLMDITPLILPVVLEMKDGQAAILVERNGDVATVLFFDEQEKTHEVEVTSLDERYNGNCYLLKPGMVAEGISKDWFWSTIRKSRGLYAEVLVASLLINLFALVTPLFIMNVYDRVVPNHAIETLWVLASGIAIVFLFDLVMKSLRGYFIDAASKRADITLSAQTFSRVMDIKMSHRPDRVGSFANNLQEFDSFREFFTSTTLIALIDLPFVILFIILIYLVGGVLAMVPVVAIPMIILAGLALQKPLHGLITETFKESAAKHAMLIEVLASLDTVKGARAEGVMQKRWETFNAKLAKIGLRSRFLSMSIVNLAQLVQQGSTIAIVAVGVYAIIDGNLSVGGLIACTILTGRCLAPMGQVAGILTRYHHSITAFNAIDRIMALPVERPAGKSFLHRPSIKGDIEFKEVTFNYRDQQISALSNLSFKITEGEKVAIIGRTGSGKTTLQKLVMDYYEPGAGAILISGTDINQIDPTDLRRNMSYVPQEISLFSGTVRENIVLGTPLATDEAVLEATKIAGILDFLNTHPQGFDLNVGERGERLSGGQRQGIAIARAIINRASILILDEPTASIDNTAEILFLKHFSEYVKDRTLLLVTHKASMLSLVDRLIVLNDGKIIADGPRDEVLKMLAGNPQ